MMDFIEWFLQEAVWHIMFPFWSVVREIIQAEWYLDIAYAIGRNFPDMNF